MSINCYVFIENGSTREMQIVFYLLQPAIFLIENVGKIVYFYYVDVKVVAGVVCLFY